MTIVQATEPDAVHDDNIRASALILTEPDPEKGHGLISGLERLAGMRNVGTLTDEEFAIAEEASTVLSV